MVLEVEKKSIEILGVPVSQLTKSELIEISRCALKGGRPSGYIVTLNPEIATLALKDRELLSAIRNALFVIPDGIGITWAVQRLHALRLQRIPGIELAEALIKICAEEGLPVYFLGSRPGISEKAAQNFRTLFPNINIAGFHHGFFKEEESTEIKEGIQQAGTALLIVGMGAGKQEKFLLSLPQSAYRLGIAVGGALEIWAGARSRAPLWMRKIGLEWLYRILVEPRRLIRLAKTGPFFLRIWCLRKRN
ncbi:MAG: WecB/TagA/CpsF family glycosyltransferase [bacterium]